MTIGGGLGGAHATRRAATATSGLVLAVVVVAVAACGNASDPSAPAGPTATSVSATTAASASPAQTADAACAEYLEVIESNGPLAIDGFDPDRPRTDQLPAVGEHFAPAVEAAERQAETLRPVAEGQSEGSPLVIYVEALEAENANSRAQVDAALAGYVDAFTATLANVEALRAARVDAAVQLGAPRCGEG